jgi:hypothetical protein
MRHGTRTRWLYLRRWGAVGGTTARRSRRVEVS